MTDEEIGFLDLTQKSLTTVQAEAEGQSGTAMVFRS
jgi:hypothetical protein